MRVSLYLFCRAMSDLEIRFGEQRLVSGKALVGEERLQDKQDTEGEHL